MNARHIHFSGRVQGVGFRETTRQISLRFQVSGTVQNLSDGRVAMFVQGEAAELNDFVVAVEERMSGFIEDTASVVSEPRDDLVGFRILR